MAATSLEKLQTTRQKLKEIESQQNILQADILKVSSKTELEAWRKKFTVQQSTLAEVNKDLSNVKKNISSLRDSQLSSQSQSQSQSGISSENKKLMRQAKELLSQQKVLVKLLKYQKELSGKFQSLSLKITSIDDESKVVARKTTQTDVIQKKDVLIKPFHTKQAVNDKCKSKSELDIAKRTPTERVSETPYRLNDVAEIKTIRLWEGDEFCQSRDLLPDNFWEVGLETVDLYERLVSGEDNMTW